MACSGIDLYDDARLELDEIFESLERLDELDEHEGDLEEQESRICELLQVLSRDREMELPGLQVFASRVWMEMASLAYAHFERSASALASASADRMCSVALVNEFMAEAIRLAEGTHLRGTAVPSYLSHHSILLWKMGFYAESVDKLEDLLRSWMRVDENFGYLSAGRIKNIESIKFHFTTLQAALCVMNQPERALVWSDRSHTRDMMFLVTGDGDRQRSAEFDMDNDKAWVEIQNISKEMGQETVILVITHVALQRTSYEGVSFMLHSGELVGFTRSDAGQACSPSELLDKIRYNNADSDLRDYYNVIVKPFETELENIQPKTLVFVPSEEFSLVPFGAMIDEDDRHLIERYALATVSSLRLLKHCDIRRQELQGQQQQSRSLVVGNPTKDLHSAKQEAETVVSFLKSVDRDAAVNFLQENEATKDSVLQLLPGSDWIHIASHGVVNSEFPDGALLLAAPEEHQNDQFEQCLTTALISGPDSERITGNEIVELAGRNPLRASAAVLSACRSGIGRVYAEGILALPRSFHISGVPSVVISLWDVRDGSTRVLMEKLYEKLLQGMDLARSLQSAVVEMIEADDGYCQKLYDARQWAPFIVSGTPFTTLKKINRL